MCVVGKTQRKYVCMPVCVYLCVFWWVDIVWNISRFHIYRVYYFVSLYIKQHFWMNTDKPFDYFLVCVTSTWKIMPWKLSSGLENERLNIWWLFYLFVFGLIYITWQWRWQNTANWRNKGPEFEGFASYMKLAHLSVKQSNKSFCEQKWTTLQD